MALQKVNRNLLNTGVSDSSDATAITIDSSENVLIGKTSSGALGTAGFEFAANDTLRATKSASAAVEINRLSDDGQQVIFYKDTSQVGSLGSEGGDALFIQGGTTSGSGLIFHPSSAFISPARNGVKIDNTIDLGKSTHRFKDIYLGGNVYLGGTGSANALDDYEEGTWTPTFGGASGTYVGKYTKIGDTVHLFYHFLMSGGMPTSSSQVQIGGLPFTSSSSYLSSGSIYARYYTPNDSTLTTIIMDNESVIRLVNINETSFDYTTYGELEASHNNAVYIIGQITYTV